RPAHRRVRRLVERERPVTDVIVLVVGTPLAIAAMALIVAWWVGPYDPTTGPLAGSYAVKWGLADLNGDEKEKAKMEKKLHSMGCGIRWVGNYLDLHLIGEEAHD